MKYTPIIKVKPKSSLGKFVSKDTTNYSFLFGDFDNDNIKNADDKYPFDPSRSETTGEILLTEELHKIRKHAIQWEEITPKVAKKVGADKYRIKTAQSCINKMRRKHLDDFTDIGAMIILVDSEKDIKPTVRKIKKKYNTIIKEKNFYRNPKDGYYVAYHLVVLAGKKKLPVEIQIKTKRQAKFHDEVTHTGYKRGFFSESDKKKLHKKMMKIRDMDKR